MFNPIEKMKEAIVDKAIAEVKEAIADNVEDLRDYVAANKDKIIADLKAKAVAYIDEHKDEWIEAITKKVTEMVAAKSETKTAE